MKFSRQSQSAQTAASSSGAAITLVPRLEMEGVNGIVIVDAFIQDATDLRAYQFAVQSWDNGSGALPLISIVIDADRADYVFAGRDALHAVNVAEGAVLNVMIAGGVDAVQPQYLATYTYRAPAAEADTVSFEVSEGMETLLRSSASLPMVVIPTEASIAIDP